MSIRQVKIHQKLIFPTNICVSYAKILPGVRDTVTVRKLAVCPNCGVRLQPLPAHQVIRQPYLAAILSFFFVGWGQWYNGMTWDGLKFFWLSWVPAC